MKKQEYNLTVCPGNSLFGEIQIPGDKSITHRAMILSAILPQNTKTIVNNWLIADDCIHTIESLQLLGVDIECQDDNLIIYGVGLKGFKAPNKKNSMLYLGNSGTALRLFAGILVGQNFGITLTGDSSLSSRPMQRIIDPLTKMGAKIYSENSDGKAPLIIKPANLYAIKYNLPVASAQVKTAVLLASLYTKKNVEVIDNFNTRDHTEKMLAYLNPYLDSNLVKTKLENAIEINVPADISSAAFFIVAVIITKNSQLIFKNIGINKTRTGILKILEKMGANIKYDNYKEINNEPRADITVDSSTLQGIIINPDMVPTAIDEFPIIFIAAACSIGTTIITGLDELKHKESNRLDAMLEGLHQVGIKASKYKTGIKVEGGEILGGAVDSRGDHRIAMAFAIAGLAAKEPITIKNCENISTSFPNFVNILKEFTSVSKLENLA